MIDSYLGLVLLILFAAGFLVVALMLASYLGPRRATRTKQIPFECGSVPVGQARSQRFDAKFYLMAVIFILFDIEVVFMYPWAVVLEEVGWAGLSAMLSFMSILLIGLIYIWRKGVLDWKA
jgi:NADH-quinone oxidoreductase subunit A